MILGWIQEGYHPDLCFLKRAMVMHRHGSEVGDLLFFPDSDKQSLYIDFNLSNFCGMVLILLKIHDTNFIKSKKLWTCTDIHAYTKSQGLLTFSLSFFILRIPSSTCASSHSKFTLHSFEIKYDLDLFYVSILI